MDALTTTPTSSSAAIEAIRQDAMHARDARIGQWFRNAFRSLMEYPQRRRVMDELAMLSDRELADIGLNRADIGRIFTMQDQATGDSRPSATVHTLPVGRPQAEVTFQSSRIAA